MESDNQVECHVSFNLRNIRGGESHAPQTQTPRHASAKGPSQTLFRHCLHVCVARGLINLVQAGLPS
jgi:hypothetical protein